MEARTVVETTCDVPGCSTSTPGEPGRGWFAGTIVLSGKAREADVCPRCIGDLLDPPDDIAAEVARFQLEDRIA